MLNINPLSQNNRIRRQPTFSSEKLADIHVKTVDKNGNETLVPGHFTKLDIENSPEDAKAVDAILKKWDTPEIRAVLNHTLCTLSLGKRKEVFALEVPSEGTTLEERIVNVASKTDCIDGLYVIGIVTKPEYSNEPYKKKKLNGCGKVMMAMMSMMAKNRRNQALELFSTDYSKKFYEHINMTSKDNNKEYTLKGEPMNSFIEKINKEYKLGEIDKYV